jgi:hypothetical protein
LAISTNIQTIAAWMQATSSVRDHIFNPQAYSVFGALSGPWPLPWFEQQDGGIHLTAAGNAFQAAMLVKFMQTNGLFQ